MCGGLHEVGVYRRVGGYAVENVDKKALVIYILCSWLVIIQDRNLDSAEIVVTKLPYKVPANQFDFE